MSGTEYVVASKGASPGSAVPFDLMAERSTLGAILLDRDAIVAVAPWLVPELFYLEKHALVYQAMLACANRREPPDLATVAAELRRMEQLDLVGGLAFTGLTLYSTHIKTAPKRSFS